MSDVGRLTATVGERTRRLVYGEPTPPELADELRWISTVDLAHLVMLTERKLISRYDAATLVRHIHTLRADNFRPLYGRPMPRGLYLAYEQHLVEALGARVGGRLHTGRSRNDLKATITAMRLRAELVDLVGEAIRLQAILLSRARAHRDVLMPIHTHHQAALPVTYGYYLAGVALALGRDVAGLRRACAALDRCPMGAGAAAGSDLSIDPARTAALLGFTGPPLHALDAVASRDGALHAVAEAASAALTLSRLATDLQLWSTAEFGFVTFPDRLVGSSSAMPQKRNAFLLEHVRAKAGTVIGAWTAAAATIRGTPFTNSIEVGTEAVAAVWPGLRAVRDGLLLTQVLVSGARPVPDRMRQRAEDGFVSATALANRLVKRGVPFRTAHHQVGEAVRAAVQRGDTSLAVADLAAPSNGTNGGHDAAVSRLLAEDDLSLPALVDAQRAGGGPGDQGVYDAAYATLVDHAAWCWSLRTRLARAERDLATAATRLARRSRR